MSQPRAITYRSIVIALALMPVNSVYLVLSEIYWATTAPTALSLFYNVVFILVVLIGLNMLLRRVRPSWALQPGELFVIYSMLSISSAICSIDMVDILPSTMAYLPYITALDNRFDHLLEHAPYSLMVDPAAGKEAATAYFTGQESIYDPAIFMHWLRPTLIWAVFIVALLMVMGGLVLVFRKPWTQHEKLAYPIIQVPMALVNRTEELLRTRAFWIGFGVIAVIDMVNGLHDLNPLWPHIPLVHIVNIQDFFTERPWRDMGVTMVSFYPFALGLVFLMPLDLAFSCWFFYFFFKFQRVLASHVGVQGKPGFPYVEEQTAGGYYAIAFIALWITRRHLWRLIRLAVGVPVDGEEGRERAESRIAAGLILCGLAFLIWFSVYYGMSLGVTLVFFLSYYLVGIAVTRMRAELGYPSHDLHAIGPNIQIVKFFGAGNMAENRPQTLALFGFYNFITRAYRSHPMPHGLEGLRIAERNRMDHMRYAGAMAIAVVAGTVVAFWAVLWVFTKYGGSNQTGIGEFFGWETWNSVDLYFTAPEPHQPYPTYAILIGLVFCLGLAMLRMALVWWPLHPVGYAVSGSWSMEQLWMCFLTGWLIKAALLKYGGARVYRPAVNFFLGVIMADFVVGSLWTIFGVILEKDVYRFWPY